ncbi:MAG: Uma2 family endonuclease, partial [Sphingomonadaceae bacterium]|nr:Uma2 family endonuclease [Sphingomonadaceae bacterium]
MASRAIDDQHWTFEEYFAWEELQPEKHELIDGQVVRKNREPQAMVGVTIRHGQTVTNLQAALKEQLRGSPCRAYGPEVRLRLSASSDSF